jgi:FkbM family methyltransferase
LERNLVRFAALARSLMPADTRCIVEVGARDCRETLGFEQLFPSAQIYAFECNPDMIPVCRGAVRGRQRIRLVENAVAERAGRLKFFPVDPATNPGASSLFRASGKYKLEEYRQREVEVEAITLASFLERESIAKVDLLWMDIQGAELAALKGLGPRLADVGLIHLEAEFEEIYSGQPLFGEVRSFLEANAFRFIGFTIYARHSADAVFANANRFKLSALLRAAATNRILVQKRLQYLRHRLKNRLGLK